MDFVGEVSFQSSPQAFSCQLGLPHAYCPPWFLLAKVSCASRQLQCLLLPGHHLSPKVAILHPGTLGSFLINSVGPQAQGHCTLPMRISPWLIFTGTVSGYGPSLTYPWPFCPSVICSRLDLQSLGIALRNLSEHPSTAL